MAEERIQDQEWFKKTVYELRNYRVLEKRIKVIGILLRRDAGPDTKQIANYGINTSGSENPDEISELEVELEKKQTKLKAIDASIESLEEREKKIIELKFKEGINDKTIYEVKLLISSTTFYASYNEAIEKTAKCMGFLDC